MLRDAHVTAMVPLALQHQQTKRKSNLEATIPDYSEHMEAPSEDVLAKITTAADELASVQARIKKAKKDIKLLEEEERELSEKTLPELMESVKLKKVTTASGVPVEVGEKIRTSLPKATAPEAFAWMEDHGHGSLVKRTFVIKFGRDDEKWADKFERDCKQRKKPLDLARDKKVEPATLNKMVRDLLDRGVEFPTELFGVFRQKVAKIG